MRGLSRLLRWLSSAALLTILLLLAWTCMDIYTASNDTQQAMYRADDVQQRLKDLMLPISALLGIVFITSLIVGVNHPKQGRESAAKATYTHHTPAHKRRGRTQMFVIITALVFIVLGVLNGGLYDVLVKAINICTECIGLG